MSDVNRISAVTLAIKNMEKSCKFYSRIPGFKIIYGGSPSDFFTIFQIGKHDDDKNYLNLELRRNTSNNKDNNISIQIDFGRIIFQTDDVDKLYLKLKNDEFVSKYAFFEGEPIDAVWGERFFHIRDPDGYQISFAKPLISQPRKIKNSDNN